MIPPSSHTLEVLDASGHLTLKWDVDNEKEASAAEQAIEALKAQGYSFFAVDGEPGNLTITREPAPETRRRGPNKKHMAIKPMAGG